MQFKHQLFTPNNEVSMKTLIAIIKKLSLITHTDTHIHASRRLHNIRPGGFFHGCVFEAHVLIAVLLWVFHCKAQRQK